MSDLLSQDEIDALCGFSDRMSPDKYVSVIMKMEAQKGPPCMPGAKTVKRFAEVPGHRMILPIKGAMTIAFKSQKHLQDKQQSKEPLILPHFLNNMQNSEEGY